MTSNRALSAREWAHRIRRFEPVAMSWVYDEGTNADEDLARRILAQAVGLRRLLDQMAGRQPVLRSMNNVAIDQS